MIITDIKDILEILGIPKAIIVGVIGLGVVVAGTVWIDHKIQNTTTAVESSVQYIPVSEKNDSAILVKITQVDLKLDNLTTAFKTSSEVNKTKFNLIIEDNSKIKNSLKTSFEGLDNSLNYFMKILSEQKKNDWPTPFYANSIK
jgi:hypothetical protein